jgi:hypothetical protein
LPLYSNYRDLAIPPSLGTLFAGIGDRVTFESLKDFAVNAYFRKDVYIKGKTARSAALTEAYLDETPFGLVGVEPPSDREIRLPHHTLRFEGPIFDALLNALAQGAKAVKTLFGRPEVAGVTLQQLRAALLRLALGDQVAPLLCPTEARGLSEAALYRVPLSYNRMALRRPSATAGSTVLASPVAGTAISVTPLETIAIRMLTEAAPQERQAWLHALCGRQELRLSVAGRAITEEDEKRRIVSAGAEEFQRKRLAKLVELAILEPGASTDQP